VFACDMYASTLLLLPRDSLCLILLVVCTDTIYFTVSVPLIVTLRNCGMQISAANLGIA
jgi:hypothetical protein